MEAIPKLFLSENNVVGKKLDVVKFESHRTKNINFYALEFQIKRYAKAWVLHQITLYEQNAF